MDLKSFMQGYLYKEQVQELAEMLELKKTGSKDELIDLILSDPDFELEDISRVLYKEDVQEICRNLDLRVTGSKEDLWDNIVEELELSVRSSNCLKNANIRTIGDLTKKTEEDIVKTRNFGKKSLQEIKEKLHEWDLNLGMKDYSHLKIQNLQKLKKEDKDEA